MKCSICKSEVAQIMSLMIEYHHVHNECDDVTIEKTTITNGYSLTKIYNYCNLLETFVDTVNNLNLSALIDNIKAIDINGKTYAQVRQELSIILKKWTASNNALQ